MLLAFAPFIAFAAIDRLVGPAEGMFAGFAVSAALLVRDWSQGRRAKVLEIGTAALFGVLGCYALLADPAWSLMGVRLVVDSGLLLIVLRLATARTNCSSVRCRTRTTRSTTTASQERRPRS